MQAAGYGNGLRSFKSKRSVDRIVAGVLICFRRDLFPDNAAADFRSVGHCTTGGGLKLRYGTGFYGIITHHRIAGQAFLSVPLSHFRCGHGHTAANQTGRRRTDSKASGVLRGAHDHKGFAGVSIDTRGSCAGQHGRLLIFGGSGLIAVVHTDDFTFAGERKLNGVGCRRIRGSG